MFTNKIKNTDEDWRYNIYHKARNNPSLKHTKQKTNVQIAQVIDDSTIKVKVWERGSGITMASGSSACAVAFSAKRLNLTRDKVQIILDHILLIKECMWLTFHDFLI